MKKTVLYIITGIAGLVSGGFLVWHIFKNIVKKNNQTSQKILSYYFVLNHWLAKRQKGEKLSDYFNNNNYKSVAIYGMKELGERLYDELKGTEIIVKCIIDQNAGDVKDDIRVISPEEAIPEVDVIVITASYYYNEIKEGLRTKVDCDIVSIDDVVYSRY